ncbi:hypothetical protein [Halodesulfovibrio sp.]|uniref:hypothetical protein n=1 Tax=Halodesulfovibrio sp. TaxID=1912772 RepID=UPI0025C2B151|nr:hypothetical protein [Halodesulfovibrio sp.]
MFKEYFLPIFLGALPLSVNWWLNRKKEQKQKESKLRFFVPAVASVLERYSNGSLEAERDVSLWADSNGADGREVVEEVLLDGFPTEIDWTVVDDELLNKIFSFSNEIDVLRCNCIREQESEPSPYDKAYIRARRYYEQGIRAWEIAKELRERIGLPSPLEEHFEEAWSYLSGHYAQKDADYVRLLAKAEQEEAA